MRASSFLAGAVTLLSAVAFVPADGCKFPEVAVERMPSIPQQKAVIVWRDGVETLVVESSFETESKNVGWVLPLPAEPTKLEVADSGMLTSLLVCLQPEITNEFNGGTWIAVFVCVLTIPTSLAAIFVRRRHRWLECLAVTIVILLVLLSFLSTLGHAGRDSAGWVVGTDSGISVLAVHRVGNYDVAVLRAKRAEALADWLKANGLKALDADARGIVDKYIEEGWCFVVARLVRDESGPATPHPIAATFAVEKAVYPMRLTSLAGSETRVELFVIADKTGAADGFRCVASDRFKMVEPEPNEDVSPYYRAENAWLIIGSVEAGELMWPGCVVTRLSRDMGPQDMDRDVEVQLRQFAPQREHFYTAKAQKDVAVCVLLWGTPVLFIVAAVIFHKMRRPRKWELCVLVGLVLLVLAGAAVPFLAMETIPVRADRSVGAYFSSVRPRFLTDAAEELAKQGKLHAGMTRDELAGFPQLLRKYVGEAYRLNPLTGKEMVLERSPGNFSVRVVDGMTYLCIYDGYGRERRVELPPGPASGAASKPVSPGPSTNE